MTAQEKRKESIRKRREEDDARNKRDVEVRDALNAIGLKVATDRQIQIALEFVYNKLTSLEATVDFNMYGPD